MKTYLSEILPALESTLENVNPLETEKLLDAINAAGSIFIVGRGRTGMIAGTFAMRLMHLGLHTYVVGELSTPRIKPEDLLIACSGSGEVRMVHQMVRIAKQAKAVTVLVTYNPKSTIARCVDHTVTIPAHAGRADGSAPSPIAFPLGTKFEESLLLYLDILVLMLMRRFGISEKEMAERHTNLE